MATIDGLIALYTRADERLRDLIQQLEEGSWNNRRKRELLRQVEMIIEELTGTAGLQMSSLVGDGYRAGALVAVEGIVAAGVAVEAIEQTLKPLIHQRAAQAIMDEAFYSILEASDHMSADFKRRIEQATITANERSLIDGVNRRKATKQAVADLNNRGITGMIAKNGAQIPADKYMSSVVHYHQRKAHVTGTENMATQNGYDLVYVNFVGLTCEMCAKYQGRVYSISGNDKRFPKLEIRPPYHSHCVHSFSVWVEEYATADEVEEMIAASGRPFVDNRTEHNIRRYKEIQQLKSRKNETRKQWIRYKAAMPNDTPNLKTFASLKARNTQTFRNLSEDYRDTVTYREKPTPPDRVFDKAYKKFVQSEPVITNGQKKVASSAGTELVGLEFRLKTPASFKRKATSDHAILKVTQPSIAIEKVIDGVSDSIRYTHVASADTLTAKYFNVVDSLAQEGYSLVRVKNTWNQTSNPYKGINAIFRSPSGTDFEVQFHTAESFDMKQNQIHGLYEEYRDDNTTATRRSAINKQMLNMSKQLEKPKNIDKIR